MSNTKVVGIIFPYILTPIPNLYDHSFPRYGQITFLTFRRPTTLTFDLKFTQTDMGITIPRPPPMGRGKDHTRNNHAKIMHTLRCKVNRTINGVFLDQ